MDEQKERSMETPEVGTRPADLSGYSEGFQRLVAEKGLSRLLYESHFGGDFESWRTQREGVARLIERDGKILDFGCANGFLLACLKEWSNRDLECYGIDSDPEAIRRARELFPEESKEHFPESVEAKEVLPKRFDTIYWNVWDDFDVSLPENKIYLERLKEYAKGGRIILGFCHADPEENRTKVEWLQENGNVFAEILIEENGHIFAALDIP